MVIKNWKVQLFLGNSIIYLFNTHSNLSIISIIKVSFAAKHILRWPSPDAPKATPGATPTLVSKINFFAKSSESLISLTLKKA